MKRCLKMLMFFAFVAVICTACEGDVTRAFRHAGYSVSDVKFVCDAFYGDNSTGEAIRFLTADRAITTEGVIYELSFGQKFSNDQNCRVADTGLRVSAIMDDSIFLATNGGIYYLTDNGQSKAYTEITTSDSSYGTYATLFYSGNGIKYTTVDNSNGIYYVMKSDGNVYGYTLYSEDRDTYPVIAGMVVVYNKLDYGDIIDYHYAGNSPLTYVRTADKVFHLTMTNEKECTTYADIQCNYVMTDDEMFEEYRDYIFAYNGSTIFSTYGRIFSLGSAGE